jgi:hypothetical protein
MIHAGNLILPYAMSDVASSIAVIDLHELLDSLTGKDHGTTELRETEMGTINL